MSASSSSSRLRWAALGAAGLLGLTACGASGDQSSGGSDQASGDGLHIVTSTNVYADLAEKVGGDAVTVEPVIDSAAQDPHSYEATPQDQLKVKDADLIVLNGGGYDAFMEDLAKDLDVPVINAVELSPLEGAEEAAANGHDHSHDHGAEEGHDHAHEGEDGHDHSHDHGAEEGHDHAHEGEDGHDHAGHDHGSFNEHIWYDMESMQEVSDELSTQLGELDSQGKQGYEDRSKALDEQLQGVLDKAQALKLDGDFVATEPVADHLLEDAGLHDATPEEFTAAVESGSDVPPLVYRDVEQQVKGGDVTLVAYNEHTSTGQTQGLRDTAQAADVPVVPFTETLQDGEDFIQWMDQNVSSIQDAAGK